MKTNHLFLYLRMLLCLLSFSNTEAISLNPLSSFFPGSQETQKRKAIQKQIKSHILSIHKSHLSDKVIGEIIQFYENRKFQPFWLVKNMWSIRAHHALSMLSKAESEGLFPANYASAKDLIVSKKNDAESLAQNEILFTLIVFRYMYDLLGGRFSPQELSTQTAMAPDYKNPATIIESMTQKDDSGAWMDEFTIEANEYQQLKNILAVHKALQESGKSWKALDNGPKLKFGSQEKRVVQLRRILAAQGDHKGNLDSQIFDLNLDASVKQFQKRHGLNQNGIVDDAVRLCLNIPIEEKIRRIVVTMERWRWLPTKIPARYVWVNIPSFKLQAIDHDKTILDLPIIVGKFYNKTPVFYSTIHQIRFNPFWTAPHHIAVQHILPKIQEDPNYFNKQGFVLLSQDRAHEIDTQDIDWSMFSEDNFPYVLRQKSGAKNALGRIRFSINNPWQIYLHSTPDTKLFDQHKRMFSSGCIRVKNPEKLATFIFNDSSRWSENIILKLMNSEDRKFVELATSMPIFIVYFTVWEKDGLAYFVDDIYKRDENLDFIIHSIESRQINPSFDWLTKAKDPQPKREVSESVAKEIFTPQHHTQNSTDLMK